ncbi:uncharacterized protein LOC128394283 [Panonychus citri]|uniref:uncharacterized protein LOC128394283 n=1 Tax=Panonychus citri TaxID=50023 RepID=UPI0023074D99|nr:uncharacterized protein LOC128394283 [Panonychus citri]
MNLNDPYDICLLTIFDKFDELEDLIIISQVCSKWRKLVQIRYEKIKALTFLARTKVLLPPHNIYTKSYLFIENINVAKVFPNLELLEALHIPSTPHTCPCRVIANVLSTGNPLRGLSTRLECRSQVEGVDRRECDVDLDQQIVKHCGNLTRLLVDDPGFLNLFFNKYKFGEKLQMFGGFGGAYMATFNTYATRMPNLKKLYASNLKAITHFIPTFPGVEKITFSSFFEGSYFLYPSYFPDLQNLHISVSPNFCLTQRLSSSQYVRPPVSKRNNKVRKVTIQFEPDTVNVRFLTKILIKDVALQFPNCLELTIFCRSNVLTKNDPFNIIKTMPNLSLLRLSPTNFNDLGDDITEKIADYCRHENRNLVFEIVEHFDFKKSHPLNVGSKFFFDF